MYINEMNIMKLKPVFRVLSLSLVFFSSSAFAVTISGWGVTANKLFQLSFDSNAANQAATRTLFATLPNSDIGSMALSPDGNSLFAVSNTANQVYKIDVNNGGFTSIGNVNTAFDLDGATTRGNEILLLNNGTSPAVWSLDMTDAALSTQVFATNEPTSIGGRASSMTSLDNNTMLFFTDEHNSSSFRRRAWTMENDGTTSLLGTVVDPLGAEVLGFNASDKAADGKVYALDGGRRIWEVNHGGALGGLVEATLVDEFIPDGVSSYGWSTVVFEPAAVVPVPAAAWLFASGLLGLVAVARRKKSH